MDKYYEMNIFASVVEEQGFSAAARALNLTPSAVSKGVARLEQRLGVRLLNRSTRRIGLTGEGEHFYDRCVQILADVNAAEAAVAEGSLAPRGTLRVATTITFGNYQLVPRLGGFLARYPMLDVDLRLSDQFLDLVDEGIDVAIRVAHLEDSSLVARPIARARRVICAAPSYLARHGTPRTPADLADHNCLRVRRQNRLNEWELEGPDGQGPVCVQVGGNFEANSSDALFHAALAGHGVIRMSTFLVGPAIESGRLVQVLADYTGQVTTISIVYQHRRHVPAKVRVFVDYLLAAYTPPPDWAER